MEPLSHVTLASFGQGQMGRVLNFKQKKETAIIYFLFTSVVASHPWLPLRISNFFTDRAQHKSTFWAADPEPVSTRDCEPKAEMQ